LRQANHRDTDIPEFHQWPAIRHAVLGERHEHVHLDYAWAKAPLLPDVLDTVAHAAREWTPGEAGMVGAAVSSRQTSRAQNKEYLRAFGNPLKDNSIAMTIEAMKAMAVSADVVINNPDFSVTYDDVAKCVGPPVETRR